MALVVAGVNAVWGLQRNMEKHFSLDFNIGLGYLTATGTAFNPPLKKVTIGQLSLMGQLNLGFWFGGK